MEEQVAYLRQAQQILPPHWFTAPSNAKNRDGPMKAFLEKCSKMGMQVPSRLSLLAGEKAPLTAADFGQAQEFADKFFNLISPVLFARMKSPNLAAITRQIMAAAGTASLSVPSTTSTDSPSYPPAGNPEEETVGADEAGAAVVENFHEESPSSSDTRGGSSSAGHSIRSQGTRSVDPDLMASGYRSRDRCDPVRSNNSPLESRCSGRQSRGRSRDRANRPPRGKSTRSQDRSRSRPRRRRSRSPIGSRSPGRSSRYLSRSPRRSRSPRSPSRSHRRSRSPGRSSRSLSGSPRRSPSLSRSPKRSRKRSRSLRRSLNRSRSRSRYRSRSRSRRMSRSFSRSPRRSRCPIGEPRLENQESTGPSSGPMYPLDEPLDADQARASSQATAPVFYSRDGPTAFPGNFSPVRTAQETKSESVLTTVEGGGDSPLVTPRTPDGPESPRGD